MRQRLLQRLEQDKRQLKRNDSGRPVSGFLSFDGKVSSLFTDTAHPDIMRCITFRISYKRHADVASDFPDPRVLSSNQCALVVAVVRYAGRVQQAGAHKHCDL